MLPIAPMGALDLDRAPSTPLAMIAPSVRRARADELPGLCRLINRAYAVEASFAEGDRVDLGELEALARTGHFLVLARHDGELVATVHVGLGDACATVGLLAVAPELQGLGLGRRLVAVAEALAAAVGCHEMRLDIVNLRAELGPWYRSQGYREQGTAPFAHRPTKQPCHLVHMAKSLGARN